MLAEEYPSELCQARPPEIDPRINIDQFLFVTEKLLGEDPHPLVQDYLYFVILTVILKH